MTYQIPETQPSPPAFDDIRFENRYVMELPGDPETANTRRQVMHACYSRVSPKPVARPELVAYSQEMAAELGFLHRSGAGLADPALFTEVLSGNRVLPDMAPYATCYGGHQFGNWAGQLGDGRAINLGEIVNPRGRRWVLQLKGAGPTPYSRTADGLAVLRSSVREFLCSEAMHHLGVPTTRALSLVLTGEQVMRDMFYDGHPKHEPGAVVCRVAPSFTRFGNFQIFASRGDTEVLRRLTDYTLTTDFPHLGEPGKPAYIAWFEEICRTTAEMIVHWMRVGFVHGVMNTDNMSILGLTIDYGPYGWLEDFDPDWTPNTTDAQGRRYRFGNQPSIALWNLVQLANAIYPLVEDEQPLQNALEVYSNTFLSGMQKMMACKLGFAAYDPETDEALTRELVEVLCSVETDMTIFYRNLSRLEISPQALALSDTELMQPLMDAYYAPDELTDQNRRRIGKWLRSYIQRSLKDSLAAEARRDIMHAANPKYVLRNYLAQLAIDKSEAGDHSLVNELLELLRHPYAEQPDKEAYAAKRPDWARHRAGCSMLSCSS